MKKFFIWKDSYNLGIEIMDDQHKKLVDIINDLYEAFYNSETKDKMQPILRELINYAAYHFKSEEELFNKFNFNQIAEHRGLHEDFKVKVLEFEKQFLAGKTITYRVMTFLREWLTDHILVADKEYADLIKMS
jgi:hemerythrin